MIHAFWAEAARRRNFTARCAVEGWRLVRSYAFYAYFEHTSGMTMRATWRRKGERAFRGAP